MHYGEAHKADIHPSKDVKEPKRWVELGRTGYEILLRIGGELDGEEHDHSGYSVEVTPKQAKAMIDALETMLYTSGTNPEPKDGEQIIPKSPTCFSTAPRDAGRSHAR